MQKRFWLPIIFLLLVGITWVFIWLTPQPVPKSIKKQVNFVIFLPAGDWKVNREDISYDSSKKVLTIIASSGNKKITLNEQATPDPFNEIPGYYDKLVE